MIRVLSILQEMTIPLISFPRMLTWPVNGHFLSMKFPVIAPLGVLKPSPMSFQYLTPLELFFANSFLEFWKIPSCFWKHLWRYFMSKNQHLTYLDFSHFNENNKISIGRGNDQDFKIGEITVSRKHLEITIDNNNIYIWDKGSKFGTLVLIK